LNPTRQPLLDDAEISALINQASGWRGFQLPWAERFPQHARSGTQASQHRGSGMDFVESRPYQAGDEPRHIDWRASARTGRPYVRIFHEEQAPAACMLIDRRASMRFGTRGRLKAAQVARLAVFLTTYEARRGSEIGAVVLDEDIRWLPPVSGLAGIHQVSQQSRSACPPLPPATNQSRVSLEKVLAELTDRLPVGTNLYLFSDFSDLTDQSLAVLSHIGQRHHVHAVKIEDIAECEMPHAGVLNLSWGGVRQTIDSDDGPAREAYARIVAEHSRWLETLFAKCGIRIDSLLSDTADIVKWLQGLTA